MTEKGIPIDIKEGFPPMKSPLSPKDTKGFVPMPTPKLPEKPPLEKPPTK